MDIRIILADYLNEQQAKDIVFLLNCYAIDPTGGGTELDEYVKNNLAAELAKIPKAFSVLCYVDRKPAGLVNCFEGFSTFKCKPLINIHDIIVAQEFRGLGISQKLLKKVEQIAKEKGCCKLTLEVLEGNTNAQKAYIKFGFSGYELNPVMGKALFWEKPISVK
ncbi:MAG: GNAT family N-acetyltransferase [Cyanobacteria bacterium SID2]|nr:GNAT family N-acetyltransferase [Cyanobacteria bacterium SID2]MBP0004571.1 GNAT family N-acetyltransferase [Cyanobacteria bacterium SBC]